MKPESAQNNSVPLGREGKYKKRITATSSGQAIRIISKEPEPYPYTPIVSNSGFRVLVLHEAPALDDAISCELIDANLIEYPPFEALSYTWGTSEQRRIIYLNRFPIQVTVNLETALKYLRYSHKKRYLWIDALCINQADLSERSNHVGYMKEVYARCTRDLLWLGKDDLVIEDAVKVMNEYGNVMDMDKKHSWYSMLESDDEEQKMEIWISAIKGLFTIPTVWKRVWIMQEIASAPDVKLIAGHTELSWAQVEAFLATDHYIKKYGIPGAFHGPFGHGLTIRNIANGALAYPQILAHQRRVLQDGLTDYGSTLLDVLARFRYTESTDPRDKLYALLGLSSDHLRIKVDYSLSLRDVYVDCMRILIEHSANLDMICQAPWQIYGNNKKDPNLPSWVCDFANPGDVEILFAQRGIFSAGGEALPIPLSITPDAILKLEGYTLGKIAAARRPNMKKASFETYPPYPPGSWQAMAVLPKPLMQEAIDKGNASLSKFMIYEHEPLTKGTLRDYYRTLMLDCARMPTRRLNEEDMVELDDDFQDWIMTPLDQDRDINLDFHIQDKVVGYYIWSFAISEEGLFCMIPNGADVGDEIVILKGAKVPMILRPVVEAVTGKIKGHIVVGSCYVHSFMDGEVFEHHDRSARERTFELV